jgi:hypothetical protein
MHGIRRDLGEGPERYCRRCDEWWPLVFEFWYQPGERYQKCRTCSNEASRKARSDRKMRSGVAGAVVASQLPAPGPPRSCEVDMAKGPYSRVYHELAEDYPEVWDSPLLADFTRLLVAAEQAYPNRAKWIGHTNARAIARLAAIGSEDDRGPLVTLDGQRFSVKGMDKERGMRSQKASNAAAVRWHGPSNAQSNASGNARGNAKPMLDEKRREKTSREAEHDQDRGRRGLSSVADVLKANGLFPSKETADATMHAPRNEDAE